MFHSILGHNFFLIRSYFNLTYAFFICTYACHPYLDLTNLLHSS